MLSLPDPFQARKTPPYMWLVSTPVVPCLLFAVLYIARTGLPSDFRSVFAWVFFLLMALLEGYLLWALAMGIHLNASRWFQSVRLLGWPSAEKRRKLRALYRRSLRGQKSGVTSRLMTALICLGLFLFLRWNVWLFASAVMLKGVIAEGWVRPLTPPVALLLSSSRAEALDLHAQMSFWTRGLRVVSLLRPDANPNFFVDAVLTFDCMRNADDAAWHGALREWTELAPIIVLDARFSTPHVQREAKLIIPEFSHKAVIAVGIRGERPLLDSFGVGLPRPAHPISIIKAPSVPQVVREMTLSPESLPTPEHPLSEKITALKGSRTVQRIQ